MVSSTLFSVFLSVAVSWALISDSLMYSLRVTQKALPNTPTIVPSPMISPIMIDNEMTKAADGVVRAGIDIKTLGVSSGITNGVPSARVGILLKGNVPSQVI